MPEKKARYVASVDFGAELTGLLEEYAEAQGVTFGSMVRFQLSHMLMNDLMKKYPNYTPRTRKRDWSKK